ncbi:MAG: hypothetical protein HZC41_01630 [Chloroflexi bacterium]|nr:hypothetical protein [Chloroflexota bacterium]
MTDERIPPADNQPVLEDEYPTALLPGGEPQVYTTVAEAKAAETPATPLHAVDVTFWGWLRRWFNGESADLRAADLTSGIEQHPETPANYVFRGELLLQTGAYAAAADDFRRALELAAQQVETARWGLVAQAVQDRALAGLERAERRLRRQNVSN